MQLFLLECLASLVCFFSVIISWIISEKPFDLLRTSHTHGGVFSTSDLFISSSR